jgi:hypothetical protein
VLLRNDVVITARHCLTGDGSVGGTLDTLLNHYVLHMDFDVVNASEIIDVSGNTLDIALIVVKPWFQTGFFGNQAYGWLRPVYSGSDISLVGSTLTCQGYGDNSCVGLNGGTGDGILRTANIPVASAVSGVITFDPQSPPAPPEGQIQFFGDSGGTCFTSSGAMTLIVSGGGGVCNSFADGPGPHEILPFVNNYFNPVSPGGSIYTSTSGNTSGNSMVINTTVAV